MYRYDFWKASTACGAARRKAYEAKIQEAKIDDSAAGDTQRETNHPKPRNLVTKDLVWRPEKHSLDHNLDPSTGRFCVSCRRLLQGIGTEAINLLANDNNGAFFEHLDGHFLEKSARNGCTICATVWNKHVPSRQALAEGEEISMRYDYGQLLGSDPQSFAVKFYPYSLLERDGEMMPLVMPIITLVLEPHELKSDDRRFTQVTHCIAEQDDSILEEANARGTSSTGSPEVMVQIAKWLEQCSCTASITNSFVPERLIDVDESRPEEVRIVDRSTISKTSRYIALSHCWGNIESGLGNSSKLVQSNIERFMSGIIVNDLPRTFTDAISVTRSLGIRYLWIDSLCIIQDSREDWERNASMMWEVYTKAYVTLAATASSDSSQGLFRTRLAAIAAPCIVNVPEGNAKLDAGIFNCYNVDEWEQFVENAPLNTRAWVLQEKLLSPRIIHFAETQVFFECLERRASERSPLGIPGSEGLSTLRDAFHKGIRKGQTTSLVPLWHSIVSEYTSLQLSHDSDKMIAVSAISRQLSDSISHSGRYINGLWENSFLGQLCWSSSDRASRSLGHKAPTWSWFSMKGHVSPNFLNLVEAEARGKGKTIAKILTTESAPNSLLSESSISLKHSLDERLHISAPLLRVKLFKTQHDGAREAGDSKPRRKRSKSNLVKLINNVIPRYTGEKLMSVGMSSNGLPTGLSGRQKMSMDVDAGLIVEHDEDKVVGETSEDDNSRRKFFMHFESKAGRGEIQTDQDMEWEELHQLEPIFMPVFCTYDRLFPEIEVLRGLILTKVEDDGVYRRIGAGTLDEYGLTAFLCALGNQEHEVTEQSSASTNPQTLEDEARTHVPLGARCSVRLKLEDIVPDQWGGKTLDFVPNDIAMYELTII